MDYEEKFSGLLNLIEDSKKEKIDIVVIAQPWVLGDNYEEIIESLSRIAIAKLHLAIVKPQS